MADVEEIVGVPVITLDGNTEEEWSADYSKFPLVRFCHWIRSLYVSRANLLNHMADHIVDHEHLFAVDLLYRDRRLSNMFSILADMPFDIHETDDVGQFVHIDRG